MRFALLGDHPDGLDMARALAESGRHELAVYSGPAPGAEHLRRWQLQPARVGDMEEVLADPRTEAVIVAGSVADRPAQLRRALQSERHVLCVHPLDQRLESAYEAAMLQEDARTVLLPLLPAALHPGFRRLADLIRQEELSAGPVTPGPDVQTAITPRAALEGPLAPRAAPPSLRLLQIELWSTEGVAVPGVSEADEPMLPFWEILRLLGGEIIEVTGLAAGEEIAATEPLLLSGVFAGGALFQAVLLPSQPDALWRLRATTRLGRPELIFPQGWPGPAHLSWTDAQGGVMSQAWDTWNPWPPLVEVFEAALTEAALTGNSRPRRQRSPLETAITTEPLAIAAPPALGREVLLSWQDEIRSIELSDAARRSVERRRASTLEYQEATEEAGFKGTMTLVGCSLIWLSLVVLIFALWVPWLIWLIIPVFGAFLLLQLLRWIVPKESKR